MSRPLRPWRRPVIYRSAIGLYVVLVLALAGISFAVGAIDVQGALYLRGELDLEKDRSHGLRGIFSYAPTGETLVPDEMHWELRSVDDDELRFAPQFVDGPSHESWPNPTFFLPDEIPPGHYELHVETSHRRVSELTADQVVTVHEDRKPPESISELQWWFQSTARDDNASRRSPVVEPIFEDESEDNKNETGEGEASQSADVTISVVPGDGELVRGLPQSFHLRTYHPETGHPVPSTIYFDSVDGILEEELVESVRTDRLGIASVDIRAATSPTLEITVEPAPRHVVYPNEAADASDGDDSDDDNESNGDEPSGEHSDEEPGELSSKRFKLNLPTVPTQYALSPTSRVVTPGDEIEAVAHSVFGDGTFMADLYDYDGNRLLDSLSLTMSDGASGVRFAVPRTSASSPLLRLQVYQSIYGTSHGWDSAYLVLLDDDSDAALRDAVVDLFRWIADHSHSEYHRAIVEDGHLEELSNAQLRRLLEVGLDELPRTFELPSVVMNTREHDRQALDVWREEVQQDLRWMMGLTLFVGILVVMYFVVIGIRRNAREAAVLRELELETSDPPPEEQRRAEWLERWTVILQGLIVFLTLLVFAIGILIMVSYL